jgi:alpha-ketoglutarate-dependent taurine dioxygenase
MGIAETGKVYPKASHPVVRTHPVTKRKALFGGDSNKHEVLAPTGIDRNTFDAGDFHFVHT